MSPSTLNSDTLLTKSIKRGCDWGLHDPERQGELYPVAIWPFPPLDNLLHGTMSYINTH